MSSKQKNIRWQFALINVIALNFALVFSITNSNAQSGNEKQRDTFKINSSLGNLKQINAGVLNVGYAEAGPNNGPAVILLHG